MGGILIQHKHIKSMNQTDYSCGFPHESQTVDSRRSVGYL